MVGWCGGATSYRLITAIMPEWLERWFQLERGGGGGEADGGNEMRDTSHPKDLEKRGKGGVEERRPPSASC